MNLEYVKNNLSEDYQLMNTDELCLKNIIEPQKTDIKFHCIKHGINFTAKWRSVRQGHGCFVCDGGYSVEMIAGQKLAKQTGRPIEFVGDTSDPKARIKKGQPIDIMCTVCGHGDVDNGYKEWKRPASQLVAYSSFGGHGCPVCYYKRSAKEQQLSPDQYQKRLFEKHGDEYIFDRKSYSGISKKCLFTHKLDSCGWQFEVRAQGMLDANEKPCPACYGGHVLAKCSDDEKLDELIKNKSEGKYKLGERYDTSFTIRCNRCDNTTKYNRPLRNISSVEHCKTCHASRPFKSTCFKEHEAAEILKRRGLTVGRQKLTSYKKLYDFYDTESGKVKIYNSSIYSLLQNENKTKCNNVPFNIKPPKKGRLWTENDKRLVMKYSEENHTADEIATLLGRTRSSVYGCIFKLRAEGYEVKNKVTKNESFFSIPTIENSYIAGLLASDGWITKNPSRVRITFKAIDEQVLERILVAADVRQSDGKIKRLGYSTKKGYDAVYATLTVGKAERWVDDLEKIFSITTNKSSTLNPPAIKLKRNQILGYISGLIEGDGSISKGGMISWCSNSVVLTDWFCTEIERITGTMPNWSQQKIKANGTGGLNVVYLSKGSSYMLYEKIKKLGVTKMDRKWNRML